MDDTTKDERQIQSKSTVVIYDTFSFPLARLRNETLDSQVFNSKKAIKVRLTR